MRVSHGVFVVALLLVGRRADAQSRGVVALSWLSGCWEYRARNGSIVEEHWSSATGATLLMFGKTVRRDTLQEYEFVRVYGRGDTLVYDAHPSGQPPTEFRALPPFEPSVVFSNPAHDFPQRVIYRRVGSDTLIARVEGTRNGQLRGIDFQYARKTLFIVPWTHHGRSEKRRSGAEP